MRLKRLVLSGFKSFCEETEFAFRQNGLTVVVGPNGCGKSNLVDAVRWVLGEQAPKQLRGGAMSDVIFNGSTERKPIGRCEVTLVFDNTDGLGLEKYRDYSEIAVTRRLYRSGESEYRLNGLPCRLMDIRELVMDTGVAGRAYSIVEQGRVDAFITASPAERRIFVEEAAGIVRYKTQRLAAERRLEQSDQNLLRVQDVLGELRRQEDALRDQVGAAREFLALREEVQALSRRLVRARYARSAAAWRRLQHQSEARAAEQSRRAEVLELLQTRAERLQADLTVAEGRLRQARAQAYEREREIQRAESDLALARQQRDHARQWIAEAEARRTELADRAAALAEEEAAAREELRGLEGEDEALRAGIARAEAAFAEQERARAEVERRVAAQQDALVECHTQLTGTANQQRFLAERREEWRRRLDGLAEREAGAQQELAAAGEREAADRERVRTLAAGMAEAEARAETLERMLHDRRAAHEAESRRLTAVQREAMELHSRLEALAEIDAGYEELGESVRAVMEWADAHPGGREAAGVLGPLADFVRVPPEVLEWAGDFLAPYLELIVVRRAADIGALEEALHGESLGRVRLVPLDALARWPVPGGNGRRFAEFVEVPGHLEPVRRGLFDPVSLLPEGSAPHAAPVPESPGAEWLAPDGRFHVDARGVMALGPAAPAAVGVLRRRAEMERLEARAVDAERQREAVADRVARLDEEIGAVEAQHHELNAAYREQMLEHGRLEQALEHAGREMARLRQALDALVGEREQLQHDLDAAAEQEAALEITARDWERRRGEREAELAAIQAEGARVRDEAAALGERLTGHKVAHGRVLSRLEHLHTRLNALATEAGDNEARRRRSEADLEHQHEAVTHHEAAIRTATDHVARLQDALAEQRDEVGRLAGHHRELEGERETLAREIREAQGQAERARARRHELELALAAESQRMERWADQLDGEPPAGAEDAGAAEAEDEAALERRLKTGQARLEGMEEVNLAAPQEYDHLQERLNFLERQRLDLEAASEDLRESIRHMNQESRRRFKETFDRVNETFQRVFPQVFGGGEGRLVLTEAEDLLLAGVDIVAQPPGKRLQGLNLLSGGEKALAAIALIFSFFLIKPSPFCLLDEVDAPLDDANVGRFNRLVRSMTERTQFIMITHNRRTMESGDLLYGVTMEEPGVSKVVSVSLAGRS